MGLNLAAKLPAATLAVGTVVFELMSAPFAAAQSSSNASTNTSAIETVTVTAPRWRQEALKAKQAAPNVIEIKPVQQIRKLPDVNVAEALQRMPGISMEADTGEGRFVNIRGMDADLNGTPLASREAVADRAHDASRAALRVALTNLRNQESNKGSAKGSAEAAG